MKTIIKFLSSIFDAFSKLGPEDEIHLDLSNREQIDLDKLK